MDNVTTPGLYVISDANTPAYCPSWGGQNSLVIVYEFAAAAGLYKRYAQMMLDVNTKSFGFRTGGQEGFTDAWHKLAEVS